MRYPTDRLARLLLVTLEAARLQTDLHPLPLLRFWLDPGAVSVASSAAWPARASISSSRGTTRGWRATFYTTGMEHSPTSATGTAWDRTPWRATHPGQLDAGRSRVH